MGMGKRIIRLIVALNLIIILFSLTSCVASNENVPSFEKFDFMKKIESFDVNNEGGFLLLVDNCINVYDIEGNFLKCVEFKKSGSSYAFFTNEGNLAVYHYRTNKLYLLNDETDQFYEVQNLEMDLEILENTTTIEGILEHVQQGENEFHIRIPTFLDFLKGNSSTTVTKTFKNDETVVFDDNGMIYCDYYISVIVFLTSFIIFFVFILFLVMKIKETGDGSRRQGTVVCLDKRGETQ